MSKKQYILLDKFCRHTNISDVFLKKLIEFDMISHQQIDNTLYLLEDEIDTIERMFRLHQDFGINTQGLDIINEMLLRIEEMESEILYLKKRLSLYE